MVSVQKANILLVDDTPANLIALEAILECLEQNLVKAHSAQEALKYLLDQEFALILLDVQMPGMDGFELAKLIRTREKSRTTPIIFVTAFSKEDEHIIKGYSIGAVDYIIKPVVPEILRAKVSVFVELFKQQEEIRRQQTEIDRSQETHRLKDEFLATVSHELRTPLNAILGWTRLLRSGSLDQASAVKALETVERNAKTQAKLIEDLLDVSRIITDKLHIDTRQVELIPIIKSAVEAVKLAADGKEIDLQISLDPWTGMVLADPTRLQQIIWNLLNNAIKFTPPKGRVEIILERQNGYAQIIIKDTGKGMSPEFLQHAFDRFSQADSSSCREHGGLGLGLAIVHHLVKLHAGTVEVFSEGEGRGSTFTVKLPLVGVFADINNLPPAAVFANELPIPEKTALAGLNILVVEDEIDTREMVVLFLEQCGAKVRSAATVYDALTIIDRWWPDALLSDINLPGKDGYELISRIKKLESCRGYKIPAIALTAQASIDDRIKAISSGFSLHIPKPVEPVELLTAITSLTGLRQRV